MIKNIYQNICEALGSNYQVFFFEKALSLSDDEKKQYKNKTIGVFYVSSADYNPLKENPGLQGRGVLYLYVPVKSNFDATIYAFESLVKATNGEITSDGTIFDYVLNWQYPTPVGNVENDYGAMRQMYAMPFSFVVSSNNLYGDDFTVKINGQVLDGITLWNFECGKSIYKKVNINKFQATNIQQYSDFSLSLEALVQKSAIWTQLQSDGLLQSDAIYEIEIILAGGLARTAFCNIVNYTQTGAKGAFQVARLGFVDADSDGATPLVTVVFDANGGSFDTASEYSLTYNANGGSGSVVDANSPYQSGTIATILDGSGLSKTGYTFTNWNTQSDGSGISYSVGSNITMIANTVLYAIWNNVEAFSVSYDANGGATSIVDNAQYTQGQIVSVIFTPTPIRADYVFVGWATTSTATEAIFKAGKVTTFGITQNTTLYAVWGYTVIFDGNGGTF